MTSKELREGNWLRYADHEKVKPERRGKEFQIIPDDIVFLSENPDYEYVHAIPLSEDWLVKFGFRVSFQYKDYDDYINDLGFKINLFHNGKAFVDLGDFCKKIEYIHQLQNLFFALTQTELSIQTSSPVR